jgi:hypothetical protein
MALEQALFDTKVVLTQDGSEEDENEATFEDIDFYGSDDELDEEERLLQRTILINFMCRTKKTNLLDTSN